MIARIALCLLVYSVYRVNADVDIITEPRPGEEYVLVSSGQQTPVRRFESSHKIPEKHPQHRIIKQEDGNEKITKKLYSGKGKHPAEGIVAIEEDKKVTFRKGLKSKGTETIEVDIPVSKLEDIKIQENVKDLETNPKMAVALEAMSESGKLSNRASTTTQKPVLTTAPPATTTKGFEYIPINFDSIDDINTGLLSSNVQLETAGSEQKQHSRIQIKKGPNGQDYEYEYVYYYYDEEDGKKEGKDLKEKSSSVTAAPIHNSHDGPQKVEDENQITKETKAKSKYSTIDRTGVTTAATTESHNEVTTPGRRPHQRGRTVAPAPVEENIEEDRLPSSTRFPPRGRNLAASSSTTYVPEVSSEAVKHRGRPHQPDNVADESIGQTRSRTRAHIRRPSSELVDLDSFKTGDLPHQHKELPTRYASESRTTTEIPDITTTVKEPLHAKETNREGHAILGNIRFQEILDDSKLPPDYYKHTTTIEQDTTEYTTMAAMEKVALDLYAYLARENLNNEVNDPVDFDGTTTLSEDAFTTEAISTTEEATTTPSTTTTTTTTTTTPAPTTTTAAPTRPSRFRGRPGARGRASSTTPSPTDAPQETSTKVRGRFNKPSGGRKSTTSAASGTESSTAPSAEKTLTTKQAFGRRGLFAGRTRPSTTTPAPAQDNNSSSADASTPRPRLRPGLKRTSPVPSSTTSAPIEEEGAEPADVTPTPGRTIGRGRPGLRPAPASLRPGARLNLRPNNRLRPGSAIASTEAAPEASAETSASEAPSTDADQENAPAPSTTAPEQPARNRLRNRLVVQPSPKPRVAVTAPVRRPNPVLKRKLATEATTEAAKKVSSETTEESSSQEKSETETEPGPVETTPAPALRGLDALFARRRAAAAAGGLGPRSPPPRPDRAARSP